MILTQAERVAWMTDDDEQRVYEVAVSSDVMPGQLYCREILNGNPALGGWSPIHIGLSPDLDTYLQRCADNFGWRVEKLDDADDLIRRSNCMGCAEGHPPHAIDCPERVA